MEQTIKDVDKFINDARPFFEYLKKWEDDLNPIRMKDLIEAAGSPDKVAVISVDVIEGFCRVGPLASDRVKGIIDPIVDIFKKAHSLGVNNFALSQDAHEEDTPEFKAYPSHCVAGTKEAETVREFKELPFFERMDVFPKNALAAQIDTGLEDWLTSKDLKKIIVVGDCTDLCAYQLPMYLRMLANARGYDWEVIVPANAVQTYDLPTEAAKESGAFAHPGDFMHVVFLYHQNLNGIKVVSEIN